MAVSCLRVTKPDQIDLIFQLVLADCVFWNLGQKYLGSFFDFIVIVIVIVFLLVRSCLLIGLITRFSQRSVRS